MRTALILPPVEASFLKTAGLPVVQRVVLSVLRSDFDRIVVVGGQATDRLRQLLRSDVRTRGVEISEHFPVIEGEEITVWRSDIFVTPATIAQLAAATIDTQPLLFSRADQAFAARCRVAAWSSIDRAQRNEQSHAAILGDIAAPQATTTELGDVLCVPVHDAASAVEAELAFCERMRRDSKASDGPLAHWVDRRVSLRLSRWIVAHTGLRPNHITLIGTSIGLIASILLGVGSYATGIAGTLLFLCATIIDGCDGEVARMKFLDSSFGQKLDVTTDNIVHVTIFLGLAIGLYHANPDRPYLTLIAILLGGFAFDGAVTYFFLVKRPGFASSGGPPQTWKGKLRQRLLGGMEAMMNRDFAYLLVLMAIADCLHWFLWGAAFGTYGFGILLILVYKWRDAA